MSIREALEDMDRRAAAQRAHRRDAAGSRGSTPPTLVTYVALLQGLYYVTSGLWPLLSMRTFQIVTGPKTDLWLVKTVGVLIVAIGGVLGVAGLRRQRAPETALLAVGSAIGLAGIDVVYVAQRRIAPVYLLDALAELSLVALWLVGWARKEPAPEARRDGEISAGRRPAAADDTPGTSA